MSEQAEREAYNDWHREKEAYDMQRAEQGRQELVADATRLVSDGPQPQLKDRMERESYLLNVIEQLLALVSLEIAR